MPCMLLTCHVRPACPTPSNSSHLLVQQPVSPAAVCCWLAAGCHGEGSVPSAGSTGSDRGGAVSTQRHTGNTRQHHSVGCAVCTSATGISISTCGGLLSICACDEPCSCRLCQRPRNFASIHAGCTRAVRSSDPRRLGHGLCRVCGRQQALHRLYASVGASCCS